jgi:rSAM/selenodomain-associated transferase 2
MKVPVISRISVIVPVLNEAGTILHCLGPLTRVPGPFEVIVVDGGSVDGTADLVRGVSGVRLMLSDRPGRASQMNAGARAASGDVLLFLHADTRLPEDAAALIHRSLQDPRAAGGRFRLRVSGSRFIYFWIGLLSTWRSRFLNVTYGDQAIYARRAAFERVGGFPDLPLFEDAEFCARLSRIGRFVMLRADAVTSARRWERSGVFRTILRMWALKLLHSLSVPPERLARYYRNVR